MAYMEDNAFKEKLKKLKLTLCTSNKGIVRKLENLSLKQVNQLEKTFSSRNDVCVESNSDMPAREGSKFHIEYSVTIRRYPDD